MREEVVLKLYPQQWWPFMKYIDDHCSAISQLKQCAQTAMTTAGIDPAKVQAALEQTFQKDDNAYLKRSRDILALAGVNKFPAVSLNGQKVKGSLNVLLCRRRPS